MDMRNSTMAVLCCGLVLAGCDGAPRDTNATHGELDQDDAGKAGDDGTGGDQAYSDYPAWMDCSQVPAECMQAACDNSLCGIGGSPYDENMCFRPECTSDDDCDSGSVCTEVEYGPVSCGDSGGSGAQECSCGNLGMTRKASICLIQKDWKSTECSEVSTDCMQAACDEGLCGLGSSRYDENMCLRPGCIDHDDCDSGSACTLIFVNPLSCETDPNTDVCDCEIDETTGKTEWICLGPG